MFRRGRGLPPDFVESALVDLVTGRRFPLAAGEPFRLTLDPSAFVWLRPEDRAAAPSST